MKPLLGRTMRPSRPVTLFSRNQLLLYVAVCFMVLAAPALGKNVAHGKKPREKIPARSKLTSPNGRFTIENSTIDDIPQVVLHDTIADQSVSVLPTMGGRVESVRLFSPTTKKSRDIILTHNGNASAIKENAMFKGCLLLPFANRIANGSYVFQGKTYHLDINEPDRHNALHGLLYKKEMKTVYTEVTDTFAILILQYEFDGSDPGYPFKLHVDVTYLLTGTGFVLDIGAQNKQASLPLPFYMGWHPYVKVTQTAATVVEFAKCSDYSHINTNKDTLIPTGSTEASTLFTDGHPIGGTAEAPTYIDDGFAALQETSNATCANLDTIIYDTISKEPVILFQTEHFRFLQVFTGSVSLSGEQAVAVEPMSAETDAYNNHIGLSILNAQQQWRGLFGLSTGNPSADIIGTMKEMRQRLGLH